MTNILRFDGFEDAEIRVTPDGQFSVYDVILFCGHKNPRQVWNGDSRGNGICGKYPEVVQKVDSYKFPGKGQQFTPVANRENTLYILGLLPGSLGKAYREEAAKVFLQFVDAAPELAESVIDRLPEKELKRIEARLQSRGVRVYFGQVLYDHGVQEGLEFAECTNAIYRPILGGTAKQLKASRGLAKKDNLRDHLDYVEISGVMFAEAMSAKKIEDENVQGFKPCRDVCSDTAKKVRSIMN